MSGVNVIDIISAAIERLKGDYLQHLIAAVIIIAVNWIAWGLLSGPMMVGYMRAMQRAESTGGQFKINDLFSGFDSGFPIYLIVAVLTGLMIGIGFSLLIIPGILIMAMGPAALYGAGIQRDNDIVGLIKRAWKANAQNLIPCSLTMLALAIIGSSGALLLGFGIVLTMPVMLAGSYLLGQRMMEASQ
jgi:hypothetical protein